MLESWRLHGPWAPRCRPFFGVVAAGRVRSEGGLAALGASGAWLFAAGFGDNDHQSSVLRALHPLR